MEEECWSFCCSQNVPVELMLWIHKELLKWLFIKGPTDKVTQQTSCRIDITRWGWEKLLSVEDASRLSSSGSSPGLLSLTLRDRSSLQGITFDSKWIMDVPNCGLSTVWSVCLWVESNGLKFWGKPSAGIPLRQSHLQGFCIIDALPAQSNQQRTALREIWHLATH